MTFGASLLTAMGVSAASAALCFGLIRATMPWLARYALARPNARSSHAVPTAQGGGAAVVTSLLVVAWAALAAMEPTDGIGPGRLALVSLAVVILAVVGAVDDVRPMAVLPRLLLQFAAAGLVVAALPPWMRSLPLVPSWVELAVLLPGLVWFINLTNFMDGIDGITVAELLPVTAACSLLAAAGAIPSDAGLLALATAGALVGFAPYNRHVARLFLGDVGSLPLGALTGFLLIVLAGGGHLAAALLLAMYYLADATITLVRRWRRGERLSEAHRSHFYQIATRRGFTMPEVTGRITRLNVLLAALAVTTVLAGTTVIDLFAVAAGAFATARLLMVFEQGPT